MMSRRSALAGVVLGVLIFSPQVTSLASAGVMANSRNLTAQSTTSTTYLAAPVSAAGSANPLQAFQATTSGSLNEEYIYIKNFGTEALIGFTLSDTATHGSLSYKRCPIGKSFTTNTKCSDNSTPSGATAGGWSANLNPGDTLPVLVTASKNNVTITISITVNNSQDRAPITYIG